MATDDTADPTPELSTAQRDYLNLLNVPGALMGAGNAAGEAGGAMQRLAEQVRSIPGVSDLDIIVPRASESGQLELIAGYTGEGRSMFGGIPIRTSDAVPEGTAYLVDRNALQFDLRDSLQLDRVGSTYGFSRTPGEDDEDFRARMRYTLTRPIDGPTLYDEAEASMTPPQQARSWRERASGILRWGRRDEPTPEPTPERLDCYLCGNRGTADELRITDDIRGSGLCGPCNSHRTRPLEPRGYCERCSIPTRGRFCDPCAAYRRRPAHLSANEADTARFLDDFLAEVEGSGPTHEELKATYRV